MHCCNINKSRRGDFFGSPGRSPSYLIIYRSHTLLKMVRFFWPTLYAWAKNYKHSFISLSHIFTGLICLVLVFFIGRLSRFCWLFSVFCHSFIHSFIHYMFIDFIVYYFILDVTISHIINVKSLIVVIRKPSFFGGRGV